MSISRVPIERVLVDRERRVDLRRDEEVDRRQPKRRVTGATFSSGELHRLRLLLLERRATYRRWSAPRGPLARRAPRLRRARRRRGSISASAGVTTIDGMSPDSGSRLATSSSGSVAERGDLARATRRRRPCDVPCGAEGSALLSRGARLRGRASDGRAPVRRRRSRDRSRERAAIARRRRLRRVERRARRSRRRVVDVVDVRQAARAARPRGARARARAPSARRRRTARAPSGRPARPLRAEPRRASRMSAMNENAARAMRMSPRHANPTRNDPTVEKSERASSPNSSPTIPPAGWVPNAVGRAIPPGRAPPRSTTRRRSPAMRAGVPGSPCRGRAGCRGARARAGAPRPTRPTSDHERARARRADGADPVRPRRPRAPSSGGAPDGSPWYDASASDEEERRASRAASAATSRARP